MFDVPTKNAMVIRKMFGGVEHAVCSAIEWHGCTAYGALQIDHYGGLQSIQHNDTTNSSFFGRTVDLVAAICGDELLWHHALNELIVVADNRTTQVVEGQGQTYCVSCFWGNKTDSPRTIQGRRRRDP